VFTSRGHSFDTSAGFRFPSGFISGEGKKTGDSDSSALQLDGLEIVRLKGLHLVRILIDFRNPFCFFRAHEMEGGKQGAERQSKRLIPDDPLIILGPIVEDVEENDPNTLVEMRLFLRRFPQRNDFRCGDRIRCDLTLGGEVRGDIWMKVTAQWKVRAVVEQQKVNSDRSSLKFLTQTHILMESDQCVVIEESGKASESFDLKKSFTVSIPEEAPPTVRRQVKRHSIAGEIEHLVEVEVTFADGYSQKHEEVFEVNSIVPRVVNEISMEESRHFPATFSCFGQQPGMIQASANLNMNAFMNGSECIVKFKILNLSRRYVKQVCAWIKETRALLIHGTWEITSSHQTPIRKQITSGPEETCQGEIHVPIRFERPSVLTEFFRVSYSLGFSVWLHQSQGSLFNLRLPIKMYGNPAEEAPETRVSRMSRQRSRRSTKRTHVGPEKMILEEEEDGEFEFTMHRYD